MDHKAPSRRLKPRAAPFSHVVRHKQPPPVPSPTYGTGAHPAVYGPILFCTCLALSLALRATSRPQFADTTSKLQELSQTNVTFTRPSSTPRVAHLGSRTIDIEVTMSFAIEWYPLFLPLPSRSPALGRYGRRFQRSAELRSIPSTSSPRMDVRGLPLLRHDQPDIIAQPSSRSSRVSLV